MAYDQIIRFHMDAARSMALGQSYPFPSSLIFISNHITEYGHKQHAQCGQVSI